jgi:hypothetical protein
MTVIKYSRTGRRDFAGPDMRWREADTGFKPNFDRMHFLLTPEQNMLSYLFETYTVLSGPRRFLRDLFRKCMPLNGDIRMPLVMSCTLQIIAVIAFAC